MRDVVRQHLVWASIQMLQRVQVSQPALSESSSHCRGLCCGAMLRVGRKVGIQAKSVVVSFFPPRFQPYWRSIFSLLSVVYQRA
ncbi:hypothetical protein IF1G_10568 [Cordyceps javanica]|uniref:Uncharacterized protein n=1 Tax=Cordyceps javanica TaxID=43265 RepID=A0A545UMY0_9HYPO|nr:hypothetical protein IF1G_10568 [Cordyceps javanica]